MNAFKISLLGIILLCFSCKNDDDYVSVSTLDLELAYALDKASDGKGKSFYILPESDNYSRIPQDPNNPITEEKVMLGQQLFHETGIAKGAMMPEGKDTYSCASCHHSAAGFQAGRRQGIGDGGLGFGTFGEGRIFNSNYNINDPDVQPIKTPSALNVAYQKLMLWNGQFGATAQNIGTEAQWTAGTPKATNNLGFEGVETQAIAGLGVHRLEIDETILTDVKCKPLFDIAFADVPVEERYTLENAGLAIAAYERTLLANRAPFQQWLKGDRVAMSESAKRGAVLFFDKAQCYSCHNGPSLGSMKFSAIGMKDLEGDGIFSAVDDATKKGRGGFTNNPDDNYKFKVPQLYSITYNGFYGHGSSFNSLKDVIKYKNNAKKENANVPDDMLDPNFIPLGLTNQEIDDVVQFLKEGLNDDQLHRYAPDNLMSGNCFPNNDSASQADLGCGD